MEKTLRRCVICLCLICICCIFMCMPQKVKAQDEEPQNISNVVIFVKFNGDSRDIYNAEMDLGYTTMRNWDEIKKMYGPNVQHDFQTGKDYDNSFQNYISVISEQKLSVTNIFPQENAAGTAVNTYELRNSSYSSDSAVVEEVLKALIDGTINNAEGTFNWAQYKLDNLADGVVDNFTVVIQGDPGDNMDDLLYSHKAQYFGPEEINGCHVFNFNILSSSVLVTDDASVGVKQAQGVIAHEFLHVLGFPDLYRRNDKYGFPVGEWDVMATNGSFLQYPLSYMRAQQGWIDTREITSNGRYTLTAVSESGGDKVFVLKTPISDSEMIVLEYRKKNSSLYGFEHRIPSSGLLMYRVDTKVLDHTNIAGQNYIYVYRPDVTDPEAGRDVLPSGLNAVYGAALDVANGETEYGSTDLSKTFTDNTLYYSDGKNSGIYISGLELSPDGNQLSFNITFADYGTADLWENLGSAFYNNNYGDAVLYADKNSKTLYMAYSRGSGTNTVVQVYKWNNSAWETVGTAVNGAILPGVAVCGNQLYLSYQRADNGQTLICRLENNRWNVVREIYAQYAQSMQFVADKDTIYAVWQENISSDRKKLVIYDVKNNTVVNEEKVLRDFGNPSVCKNGSQIYVLYSDFFAGNGQNNAVIDVYDMNKKTWSRLKTFPLTATNVHSLKASYGKIYAFVGKSGENPIVSVFDGACWKDAAVAQMSNFINVSLDIIEGEIYLTYMDTTKNQAWVLRGSAAGFEVYCDDVGTGLFALASCSMDNAIYTVTKAMGVDVSYVKKKNMIIANYALTLNAPPQYTNAKVYIDGIETAAVRSGLAYSLNISHSNARTAVLYNYDSAGIPQEMYVYLLKMQNGQYVAEAAGGLENLLSYHGFSIRIKEPAGIRFKSGINAELRAKLLGGGVDGFYLEEYGTMYMAQANRGTYPFVWLGGKVASGRSYWVENAVVNDNIIETKDGRYRFASVLTNLPGEQYATEFAFRSYIILQKGGERYLLYGPPVSKSIYSVAKQLDASGMFLPGSNGYDFIKSIIRRVETGN